MHARMVAPANDDLHIMVLAGLCTDPQIDRPTTGHCPPQRGVTKHPGDRRRSLHRQSLALDGFARTMSKT